MFLTAFPAPVFELFAFCVVEQAWLIH